MVIRRGEPAADGHHAECLAYVLMKGPPAGMPAANEGNTQR
jgi:hypothetical protein